MQNTLGIYPKTKNKTHLAAWYARLAFLEAAARSTQKECIIWPWGKIHGTGYGRWSTVDEPHRLSLAIKLGRHLSQGEQSQHECDNPPCCNGSHLKSGTPLQNVLDAISRGRWKIPIKRGEDHYRSKITEETVRKIRAMRLIGIPYKEIMKTCCVTFGTIDGCTNGSGWKHVV